MPIFFNHGLLNAQSKTIAVSAIILAASSVASRLLGILRDWLLAQNFGASPDLDVYFAAFRIPDFVYNILVFGGIAVAFLPLFSEFYAKNKEEAWRFCSNTLNVFLLFLAGLSALLFLFAPALVSIIAPGFDAAQLDKLAQLTRLMLLSPVLFGASSIFSGVLQYFNRFLAYSLAAVLYNLGIIAGILFLAPVFGITGVALGVILGALLYLLIQIPPAVKCGFRYSAAVRARDSSIKRILWLMAPRTFGIAANQINQIVTNAIASTLAAGSVAIFNLANNLYSFPVGIFGVSWAMAAFPAFSKHFASLDLEGLAKKFSASWRQVAYFVLPISFLMFALRGPIVSVLYFHGKFTAEAAALAAASLGLFCLGIYFASLMPVMFRLFFSFHDTASPTVSTVVSVAANVALNFVFIGQLKNGSFLEQGLRQIFGLQSISDISILGLSLAYSAANILQFSVLTALLFFRKPGLIRTKEITHSFTKALAASVIMFFAADAMNAKIHPAGTLEILIAAGAISLAAAAIYLAATAVFRSPELAVATAEIKRKFKKNGTPGRDR